MKTLLLTLISVITLKAEQPCTNVWAIEGKILSVADEGVLVVAATNSKFGMSKPNGGDIVFVYGKFPNVADDDPINVRGCPVGTYRYTAANGAAKTVRAFVLRR